MRLLSWNGAGHGQSPARHRCSWCGLQRALYLALHREGADLLPLLQDHSRVDRLLLELPVPPIYSLQVGMMLVPCTDMGAAY